MKNSRGRAIGEKGDSSTVKDVDDKFGLAKVRDPMDILSHLHECQYSYGMNDLIYFIRRLTQMHQDRANFKDKKEFKELIVEVKDRLANNRHETFPLIGSYAKCFKDLEVYDKKLWELMEEKVNDD